MRINPILNSKVEATGTSLIESWLYWIVSNYFIKIDIDFFSNSLFSLSGLWIENTASYKTIGHTSQSPSRRMYTVNFEIATKKSTRINKKLCVYLHIPKTLNKNIIKQILMTAMLKKAVTKLNLSKKKYHLK